MRILLDTNIFIYREDNRIISKDIQKLFEKLNRHKAEVLVHPASFDDIDNDKDQERREIVLSKVKSYPKLQSPPNPQKNIAFMSKLNWDGKTNIVDITLLYSIYKNAVDFLITEDKGIHKHASLLQLDNRVLLVNEAFAFFNTIDEKDKIISPPAVKFKPVYNLEIDDPIFDVLKIEYSGFEEWFAKISRQKRKCWVHYRNDQTYGALLIYKIEDEELDSIPMLPKMKRLKLCTFIVTHIGNKIGELFIKLSVEYALKNNIAQLYLTHYSKTEDYLVQLITEYGFYKAAQKNNGEDIFVKDLIVPTNIEYDDPISFSKKYYPSFYDGNISKKFIIPIIPEYHGRLFTDYDRQSKLLEHFGEFIVEGNTIKKAYLTHSKIKKMKAGDIVLFYRSRDKKSITSIGVINSFHPKISDSDKILKIVGKRTVYSKYEIYEMTKKETTVILFTHHFHFDSPIKLREMIDLGILNGVPQSIVEITNKNYKIIKEMGGIDERFTFN